MLDATCPKLNCRASETTAVGTPRGLAAVKTKIMPVGGLLKAPSKVPNVSADSTRILLTTQIPQLVRAGVHPIPLSTLSTLLMLPPEVVLTLTILPKCLVATVP